MMLPQVNKNVSRVSNAYSENHARIYQNNILNGRKDNTVGEVLREVIKYNESIEREHILNASGKHKLLVVETPHYPDAATNPLETEKWGRTEKEIEALNRKRKKKYNIFDSSHLKRTAEGIAKTESTNCSEKKELCRLVDRPRGGIRSNNSKKSKMKNVKKK